MPGVRIIGTAEKKAAVLSFAIEGVHPHDVGTLLNQDGIAIRTGHHCAQPVMQRFKVPATSRASFAFYNNLASASPFAASALSYERVMHPDNGSLRMNFIAFGFGVGSISAILGMM